MKADSSIRTKVVQRMTLISLVSIILVSLAAMIGILFLRQSIHDLSEELGDSAASDSKYAMEVQTKEMLQNLARDKADISGSKLKTIANYVNIMSAYATDIMSNPEDYNKLDVLWPDPENEGLIAAQLQIGGDVVLNEVQSEIYLMSNVQHILISLLKGDEGLLNAYIGTENGVSITADKDSHKKENIFEPRERPWYMAAKENNDLVWTDVYDDRFGRGLAITCAKPYYDALGNISGVVGAGTLMNKLNEVIIGTQIGETGYAFVLNENGQMIISPTIKMDNEGKILRESLLESDNKQLQAIALRMTAKESGIEKIVIDGIQSFIAFEPFDVVPWSVAAVISVEEAIRLATESEANIISLKDATISRIDFVVTILSIVFILLVTVIAFSIRKGAIRIASDLTNPIIKLTEGAKIIGGGDFRHELDVKTGDEIETLALTFNKMIYDIKKITGEKERIGAELNVATKIQASMLPCIFPPFPEHEEFDIFATMRPAKEVGGDFYDFFFIDESKLAVVIADVSGKGVPAALFMVIAKTLIKNNAQHGQTPTEVFETVNNMLCENNEASMFVTALMGYLDILTGKFTYVNAGHNPPVICHNDGNCEWMPCKPGFVLAGFEGISYKEQEIMLSAGDMIFLYTDGVTEAVDMDNNLFSEPKLLEVMDRYKNNELKELLISIKYEIDRFANGAEQADDITMLALRVKGGSK